MLSLHAPGPCHLCCWSKTMVLLKCRCSSALVASCCLFSTIVAGRWGALSSVPALHWWWDDRVWPSALPCCLPAQCCTWKEKICRDTNQHVTLLLEFQALTIHWSGAWSVTRVKCVPVKKYLSSSTAQGWPGSLFQPQHPGPSRKHPYTLGRFG